MRCGVGVKRGVGGSGIMCVHFLSDFCEVAHCKTTPCRIECTVVIFVIRDLQRDLN